MQHPDLAVHQLEYAVRELGLRGILSDVQCEQIDEHGLVVTTANGTRRTLPADTMITAFPLVPNTAIHDELTGCAPDVRDIGDAREPGLIFHAIRAGAEAGRAI